MPHLPIILDWANRMNQLKGYADTIHENIDNNEYHGQELQDAEDLLLATKTEMDAIDAHATSFDAHIADVETFLGI